MNLKNLFLSNFIAAFMMTASSLSAQSNDISRTEYGHPDFQGTYTYRTITPLNRPSELSGKEVLSEVEATEWETYENRRQNRDLIIDSVGGAGYPPCLLYTSPSPRDRQKSRMPSSA